jgi:hypothetical protein
MISAIVAALDKDNLLISPTTAEDLDSLKGRRIRYVDSSDRIWPGKVIGIDGDFLVIAFDKFPTGLGQGQLIDILEDSEDINYLEK